MNHWNYTQLLKDKPSIEQREKENLTIQMIYANLDEIEIE